MSRDQDDVLQSMQESVDAVDSSISTSYGPIYESALVPFSGEAAYVEGEVEHLSVLYQLENLSKLTDDEVKHVGDNFGVETGSGDPSQGFLTFFAMEAPAADIVLPVGTLASTEDGNYVYKTIEQVTMYTDTATAYYNSSTRRYEIKVAAEAAEEGSQYDAKRTRIKVMMNPIDGISGVTNEEDFEGGDTGQTIFEFGQDIAELPLGNSLGSPGGIKAFLIRAEGGVIQDSAVVTPADTGVYERLSSTSMRMGIDVYVVGSRIGVAYDSYTTVGTETTLVLENQPTLTVSSVLVNGTSATFSRVSDPDITRRGSTNAQDSISWTYPSGIAAGAGNSIYVTYTYNKLIVDLQGLITNVSSNLFHASTLVREGKVVPVTVEIVVESYGIGIRLTDVEDWVSDWFKDTTGLTTRQKFLDEADPTDFKDSLQSDLGVTLKTINLFNRPDKATADVQTIIFDKNEYPDPTLTILGG